MPKNKKYCPRCGALIHAGDAYCIQCGYSFRARTKGKGTNPKTIIIAVAVLLIFWIGLMVITKQPIIPPAIIDLFKNMTSNKTG